MKFIFSLILIATVVEGIVLISATMVKNEKMISPVISHVSPTIVIADTHIPVLTVTPITPDMSNTDLMKIVEKELEGADGTYGVVLINLKTRQEYILNGDREFNPASLYKLWVMVTVYQKIQNGQLDKNDVLSQDIGVLNSKFDIDPTIAEQTEGTVTMTVSEALEKMITRSDNYAALLLSEKVNLSSVSKYLSDVNLLSSKLGEPPITTANDVALFLEKLYKRNLANEQYTQEMLELLKRQKINNKLPKNLDKNIVIAHKTGELDSFSHDAGIIFTDRGDYIVVVMSETDDRIHANEIIAKIAKEAYDYFSQSGS